MKPVLIDTSAWILALRKGAQKAHRDKLDQLIAANLAATTGLVITELLAGTKTAKEFRDLRDGLSVLIRFDPDVGTWERAAEFAFRLRRKGLTVPITDVVIMTVALENDCALLHADRHFDLIAGAKVGLEPVPQENLLAKGSDT
ncbi:type II toxin-antitoxin system VapC family toxin [Candidatus Bipolaricaulota sp. J31]